MNIRKYIALYQIELDLTLELFPNILIYGNT